MPLFAVNLRYHESNLKLRGGCKYYLFIPHTNNPLYYYFVSSTPSTTNRNQLQSLKIDSTTIGSDASRMRAGQGICVRRQGILGHFTPLLNILGAKGLFKDTSLFEGRGCIPPPP